ncbi:MAG: adenylate/guanylate cyclase domain-containing protein [Polaromonas sp.]|uniref:CHASE2 domain-containing protein n=1 Tax=Polaromonas sp. TaxID=1869339 RepID=UPI00272F4FE8|nr:adenylate/guanylate cyclase domain-containing protein [Polaromonas sp.]MDP2451633.1 adenylate/guanylate cyclase domain-containing protein [Polaromonas sp.]MDP3246402.1 adenylate/guanylate cyclase domain-containing protein [Polaromonas sp.]MDP3756013.1 adenylate/guanylate cyclase domain-containing protein [Polaromonas sp.]
MRLFSRHWPRIAVTLIPLVFALLHASGALRLDVLQRLDDILYDARLRATMPRTLDERIVIVDIDEKSLAEAGRWPWGRNKLAALVDELLGRQQAALLGFDVVFAEADDSSGLKRLQQLARNELKDQPAFTDKLGQIQASLDYDAVFAKSLENRPVVLGYYFTSDRDGRVNGVLPAPVMEREALKGRPIRFTSWNGFGANIDTIARAAPLAGFFNSITEGDGVVRSVPLLAEYKGEYYESLSLAMFRMLVGQPGVEPGFPQEKFLTRNYQGLESILLRQGSKTLAIPVDDRVATLVPFRGPGGASGGSYRYISASDVLAGKMPPGQLKDKIVLLGTTAPGLLDLRVTPVGETYPGVETHANVISGFLDGKVFVKPDYAVGFEVVVLVLSGLTLALALPLLSAPRAVATSAAVTAALVGLNFWLYSTYGLVLPLATALVMALTAFALNMSYGYFVESRSKRELANLFGTYVPPELVDEMVKDPDSYSMKASAKELTVMFCDMRGFTRMSETMEPTQLQALLNSVFSRLTDLIRSNRGTIDKYMGDCVMAFWGAPVETPEHAALAVKTSLEMVQAVRQLNEEHRSKGLPEIGIGIGLNTGSMCVGDMGSDIRRSYTVIGDAVNLGSRLEGLSKIYGVDTVVSASTRDLATGFAWQELDRVRVKGKDQAVAIFCPAALPGQLDAQLGSELREWVLALRAYRNQAWDDCDVHLLNLQRMNAQKYLYRLYAERVASMRLLPFDPEWDGATNFETK